MYLQTSDAFYCFLDLQAIIHNSVWLDLHCLFCGLIRRGESDAELHARTHTHCCRLGILNGGAQKPTSFGKLK